MRAFKAGWGGVVWKTLGEDPPVVNVSSRYGALHSADQRMIGFNNIELITDRPLDVNLREIKQVKRDWPDRAVVVSLMVPCTEDAWKIDPAARRGDRGRRDRAQFRLPARHVGARHGIGGRPGAGICRAWSPSWCKQHTRMPVIVKLTPNITDIRKPARAAKEGGADAVSLINTINSITSIDLDIMAPTPTVDGKGTHGGYCGPAVKPIAMHMVADIARDKDTFGLPISAIGGIANWRDAAEFISLSAGTVQVCTAAMHYGFKIVDDMVSGLSNWMDSKGYATIEDFRGKAVPNVTDWQFLNINYKSIAQIDQDKCIKCGLCHIACEDTSHQSIAKIKDNGSRALRGDRGGVRGLQPVRACLPGAGVHHHGFGRDRQALSQLDPGSAQPDAQGGGIV